MAFFGGRQLLPLFFFTTTVDSVVGILAAALCVCVFAQILCVSDSTLFSAQ